MFSCRTMEDLLAQHKENPLIKLVYFPFELTREKSLMKGKYQIKACIPKPHFIN